MAEEMEKNDALYRFFKELQDVIFFLEIILKMVKKQDIAVNSFLEHLKKPEINAPKELKILVTVWSGLTNALFNKSGACSVARILAETKKLMNDAKSQLIVLDDPRVRP